MVDFWIESSDNTVMFGADLFDDLVDVPVSKIPAFHFVDVLLVIGSFLEVAPTIHILQVMRSGVLKVRRYQVASIKGELLFFFAIPL